MLNRSTGSQMKQSTATRHSTWLGVGSQLFAARTSADFQRAAQHLQLNVASLVKSNSISRGAAFLGLARGSSLVSMNCLAKEAVATSLPTADTGTLSASYGVSTVAVAPSPDEGQNKAASMPDLLLSSGAFVLPHPDKVAKGGEDWYFIAANGRAVGVADGVGGWSEVGVDAGAYARQLMGSAEEAAEAACSSGREEPLPAVQPELSAQDILLSAYNSTTVRGSSTACVAVLNGDSLAVSNLGDSGLLVLRAGKVAFHTPQQQHGFNFPYQIGSPDSMSDHPSASQRFEFAVQPGDLVVLGTDGLWDNCFDEEVASVLRYCADQRMEVPKMAQVLAHYARHRASDSKFASPFAYAAFQAGYAYMGGKMDDITVIVSKVQQQSKV